MPKENLENAIAQRFNELKDVFPERIESSDYRIMAIFDFFGNVRGRKILDIGCGKGRYAMLLSKKGALVTGVDSSNGLLQVAKKTIKDAHFMLASATDLPFENDSFDYVLCVETLEHIPETDKAIKEMTRVLKTKGGLIILDKNKLSLHPRWLIPNVCIKKGMEILNRWFYPRGFPFVEKWFFATELSKILKKYCRDVESQYLKDRKRKLFCFLPFLNLFIVWKGIK